MSALLYGGLLIIGINGNCNAGKKCSGQNVICSPADRHTGWLSPARKFPQQPSVLAIIHSFHRIPFLVGIYKFNVKMFPARGWEKSVVLWPASETSFISLFWCCSWEGDHHLPHSVKNSRQFSYINNNSNSSLS